jgi:hypothetical protein
VTLFRKRRRITTDEPLTYQEALKRYRADRPSIVVPSAEGPAFIPEDANDAWSEERQDR